MSGIRRYLRHAMGPLDQVLTSISNLLLSIGVASRSTVDAVGEFAVLYGVAWFSIGFTRAIAGETALGTGHEAQNASARSGPIYVGAAVGSAAALVAVVVGIAFDLRLVLFGAIAIPAVVVQDTTRYISFSLTRPAAAFASDGVRLGLMVGAAVIAMSVGAPGAYAWIAGWGLSAVAAAMLSILFLRLARLPTSILQWLRANRKLSTSVGLQFVLNTGTEQVVMLLIPLFSSLETLATLKVTQVAVGPLNVLLTSMGILLLPRMFRLGTQNRVVALRHYFMLSSALIGAGSLAYGALITVAPDGLMSDLFGASWSGAFPSVLIITAETLLTGIALIGGYVMRALGRASLNASITAAIAPAALMLPLVGAALWGTVGAAWGLFLTSLIWAIAWSVLTLTMTRRGQKDRIDVG